MFGSSFSTWRGLPILPTNKLYLIGDFEDIQTRSVGASSSTILLMRISEQKQGVISLYAEGSEGTSNYPFITIDQMNVSDDSVVSYLLTMYAAMAVLTPGALCSATVKV